mgnify:CR=1 FL=1
MSFASAVLLILKLNIKQILKKKKKKKINTNFHFFLYRAVSPGSSGKESNSHYSVREQKHIFSDSPSTPLCIE